MQLTRGHIDRLQFQDAVQFSAAWLDSTHAYVVPPSPLKEYLLKDQSWTLLTANWSPDFPTAAQEIARFWTLGGGAPVDGVIAINVKTLEQLLALTGPTLLPQYGVTVNSANAYDLTEQFTHVASSPIADRKEFLSALSDALLRELLQTNSGSWSDVADAILRLGVEKNLLIYAFDPILQRSIAEMGWSASQSLPVNGDYLMLVDASVNSTKLNAALREQASIDVNLDESGSAHTSVAVSYESEFSNWARGRDPDLVRRLMLGGLYGGYVRVFTRPTSRIVSVRDKSGQVGAEEIGSERGFGVFGRFFALPRDTTEQLSFDYITPNVVVGDAAGRSYRLRIAKQPGRDLDELRLHISLPPTMCFASVIVDGVRSAIESELSLDPIRDHDVEFSFERC